MLWGGAVVTLRISRGSLGLCGAWVRGHLALLGDTEALGPDGCSSCGATERCAATRGTLPGLVHPPYSNPIGLTPCQPPHPSSPSLGCRDRCEEPPRWPSSPQRRAPHNFTSPLFTPTPCPAAAARGRVCAPIPSPTSTRIPRSRHRGRPRSSFPQLPNSHCGSPRRLAPLLPASPSAKRRRHRSQAAPGVFVGCRR